MKKMMIVILLIFCFGCSSIKTYSYEYDSANPLNPLRGIAIWNTSSQLPFPFTLEYVPIKLNSLYKDNGNIDFSEVETQLNKVANRGNQVILRIVACEPSASYIPNYYIQEGVSTVLIDNSYEVINFSCPIFLNLLEKLILKFGLVYDGDPRIGFIQLGLIGRWGEWNYSSDYNEENRPSIDQYNLIYQAFDNAFNITKLMARNPNLGNPVNYNIGFHDDSFMTSTLGSGGGDFKYLIEKGNISFDLYKYQAFGAELSGVENGDFFSTDDKKERFINSVKFMNTSFMMWQKYDLVINNSELKKYDFIDLSRELGYEISVVKATKRISNGKLVITIYLKNTKNAPFYYDWEAEIKINDLSFKKTIELSKIMPNEVKSFTFTVDNLEGDVYFKIINPLSYQFSNAKKFYLANKNIFDDSLKLF